MKVIHPKFKQHIEDLITSLDQEIEEQPQGSSTRFYLAGQADILTNLLTRAEEFAQAWQQAQDA